jgi:hypothetical protein
MLKEMVDGTEVFLTRELHKFGKFTECKIQIDERIN